jgi:Kdo2-lipid IVA lauroyltransferase/acyltransferase
VERLSPLVFSAAIRALSLLSLNGQRRIGRWLGRLAWWLRSGGARTTMINLDACFPELEESERRCLAVRSLEHTGMLVAELGAVYGWSNRRWAELTVAVEGAELIDAARAAGRGVLVLVPHFGNWEHLALVLGGYGVTALYDPPRIRALEPLIRDARNRAGATMLPIDAGGLRGFYRALAAGGVAALLPDQVPERQAGVYADFFGNPALTMTFAHRVLERTGACPVLGAAIRCQGGFRVCFSALDRGLGDPDPQVSARVMNRAIEELVRTDVAQYQWEYKRFKRRGRGDADPYAR